jgi:hypothetical protein
MVYRGHVSGDVIVLSPGVHLPEGTEVLVAPIETNSAGAPVTELKLRNGIALFESTGLGSSPNLDLVNKLRDDAL